MQVLVNEATDLILQGKPPSATGVKIFSKILKRPKNREDSADFNDFWTELIALAWAIISKKNVHRGASVAKNFENF